MKKTKYTAENICLHLNNEILVDIIGLTLTISILLSFVEFIIVRRVDVIPLILGLLVSIFIVFKGHLINAKKHVSESNRITYTILVLFYSFIILSIYFIHYLFPAVRSADFIVYIKRSLKFTTGSATYRDLLVLHPAIYLLLGSVFSLNIFNPVILSRLFMTTLVLLSIPLLYELSRKLYGKLAGEITLLLSIFVNIFWYYTIIVTGLYANFLGIMLSLYLLILIKKYIESRSKWVLLYLFLTSLTALLSHETTFLLITAIWISALYHVVVKKSFEVFKIAIIVTIPVLILLITTSASITLALKFITEYLLRLKILSMSAIVVGIEDPITTFLNNISPLLANIYAFANFIGLTLFIASIALFVVLIFQKANGVHILPFFWVIVVWIISFFTTETYRLALYVMFPMVLFLGSLGTVLSSSKIVRFIEEIHVSRKIKKILKYEIISFIVILMFVGSGISRILAIEYLNAGHYHKLQHDIMETLLWLKENTPENSRIISVGRWEFLFAPYIINRECISDYPLTPNEIFTYLKDKLYGDIYVIVWNALHNATVYYIHLYENDHRFLRMWSNNAFTVFKLRLMTINKA